MGLLLVRGYESEQLAGKARYLVRIHGRVVFVFGVKLECGIELG